MNSGEATLDCGSPAAAFASGSPAAGGELPSAHKMLRHAPSRETSAQGKPTPGSRAAIHKSGSRAAAVQSFALLLAVSAKAQTLVRDPIGIGPSVGITGSGAAPSSSVELFKNNTSLGSQRGTGTGLFSFPGIATAAPDSFQAADGQVWNFSTAGQSEGWTALPGDTLTVSSGRLVITNTTGADLAATLYGDGLIGTRRHALEVRLRLTAAAPHTLSLILHSAGPNGVAGGGAGAVAILTVTSAQNARGIPIANWPVTFTTLPGPDSDADGMSDAWEDANGFDKLSAADAVTDAANDGATNLLEFHYVQTAPDPGAWTTLNPRAPVVGTRSEVSFIATTPGLRRFVRLMPVGP